jgi:hypothetical protein
MLLLYYKTTKEWFMDITKKTLIATFIINIVLIAIAVACMIITKFNTAILWLSVVMIILVCLSSIIIWRYGKEFKK